MLAFRSCFTPLAPKFLFFFCCGIFNHFVELHHALDLQTQTVVIQIMAGDDTGVIFDQNFQFAFYHASASSISCDSFRSASALKTFHGFMISTASLMECAQPQK